MKIKINLKKYNIDLDLIKSIYNDGSRQYHNFKHIKSVIKEINKYKSMLSKSEYRILVITALYHDIVYVPLSPLNELKSTEYIDDLKLKQKEKKIIKDIILFTEYKIKPKSKLQNIFLMCDMAVFNKSKETLRKYEKAIREEFYMVSDEIYYKNRIKILKTLSYRYHINIKTILEIINEQHIL